MMDFKSWLPIAIAAIVALPLYFVITGRCGELLFIQRRHLDNW